MATSVESISAVSSAGAAAAGPRAAALSCVQSPATGFAGAATMIGLYVSYTLFEARLAGGGPDWNGLWGFQRIARDYLDILLCLLVTFTVMIVFEKGLRSARWAAGLIVAVAAWVVANSGVQLWQLWGESLTLPEAALLSALGALIVLLAVDLSNRKRLGVASPLAVARPVSWGHALRSGFWRWLSLWSVLSLAVTVYLGTKLYAGIPAGTESYYLNWRVTSVAIWWGFTVIGLPYCAITVKRRSCVKEDRSDPGLVLVLLARRLWKKGPREVYRLVKRRRIRVVLLDLVVKGFWAPLMVTFLFGECGSMHSGIGGSFPVFGREGLFGGLGRLFRAFFGFADGAFLESNYQLLYHGLFVVDCSIGLLGYLTSSRWLGTKSKSVETTALGWWVALTCYPPFNGVTGQIVPYDQSPNGVYWLFSTVAFHHAMMLCTLALFSIYVWATIVFGLRFSNLTHRGLIATGPYRYIRHPAYATKNLAWWTESLVRFGSPWQFVYLAGLNFVYFMRAMTEERHLRQSEDYRRYAEQVRWRFLPGVF